MLRLKEHFTDGLLQIAIVLSLLRTDLDLGLAVQRYDQPRHVPSHRLNYGPLLGYAQTDFRLPRGDLEYDDVTPLKGVGVWRSDALRDIHSLAEFRRFDGLQTGLVATWLVDGPEPQLPVQRVPDIVVPAEPGRVEIGSPAAEPVVEEIDESFSTFFGSELTKEDMDLIEILWRQDMDLGISRDMFSSAPTAPPHQSQLEKLLMEKDDEVDDATEEFTKEEKAREFFPPANPAAPPGDRYIVDNETGEILPIGPSTPTVSVDDVAELFQQISPGEAVDPEFGYLPENQLNSLNATASLPYLESVEEYLAAEAATTVSRYQPQPAQQYQPVQAQTYQPMSAQQYQPLQAQQYQPMSAQPYQPVEQLAPSSSLEQGWQDVLSLLDDPTIFDEKQTLNEGLPLAGDLPTAFPFNASPFTFQQAPGLLPNNFSFSGDFDFSMYSPRGVNEGLGQNASFAGSRRVNDGLLMTDNFTLSPPATQLAPFFDGIRDNSSFQSGGGLSPIFDVIPPSGLNFSYDFRSQANGSESGSSMMEMGESLSTNRNQGGAAPVLVAEPLALGRFPSNDSFIREFLQNDLGDLNFDETLNAGVTDLNFDGLNGAWSPDSAVSSMPSPTELLLGNPLAAALPMDGVDQVEDASSTKQEMKYANVDYYQQYDSDSLPPHQDINSSCSANSSSPTPPQAATSPKHVYHNHTYYLQPGQVSREERDAELRREKEEKATRSRDIKRAKALKLPFAVDDIIDLPVDKFTEMLSRHALTEAQHQLVRDIRRRGKNKAAAQNCRKRKLEVIQTLEEEVEGLRRQKDALARDKDTLAGDAAALKEKFARLQAELLRNLRDAEGRQYDPREYALQRTADGDIILVPRDAGVGAAAGGAVEEEDEEMGSEDKGGRRRKPKRKE